MLIILLLLAMIFNVGAQMILKAGISKIDMSRIDVETFFKVITSFHIWIGAFAYGMSFIIYIFALSKGELSKISPVSQALTIIGIVAVSVIFFNEPVTWFKLIGIILLIAGTVIIFQ